MIHPTPSPADIAELEQLTQRISEEGENWMPDSSPYTLWIQQVKNLIVRCYIDSDRRLNELHSAASYRRMASVISWHNRGVDSSKNTNLVEFRKNIPKLKSHVLALLLDLKQRAGVAGVPGGSIPARPLVFIAHGGRSAALSKVRDFLQALGCNPIIAEDEPSEGRSINEQVEWCMSRSDCAIVLAEAESPEEGKVYARPSVLIEIGRFQERFPSRTIYLREEKAQYPSNVSEKVWEQFMEGNMERAFLKIVRELVAFGFLRAEKSS